VNVTRSTDVNHPLSSFLGLPITAEARDIRLSDLYQCSCRHCSVVRLTCTNATTSKSVRFSLHQNTDFVSIGATIWRTGRNARVVPDSGSLAPLSKNMTLCAKPEVHNVFHCRHWRTEPRPQVKHTENLAKLGRMFFKYVNRQTGRHNVLHFRYWRTEPRSKTV